MAKTFDGMKDNGFKGEPSRFYETVPARNGDAKTAASKAIVPDEGGEQTIYETSLGWVRQPKP